MRMVIAMGLALVLSACSVPNQPHCLADGKTAIETQLYFGLSKSNGEVSAREWQAFVAHKITPRFPEGFTVLDANGFWLSKNANRTISENSKILISIHNGTAKDNEAINAIIADYKHAFAQESVLRVDENICASF